MRLHQFGIIKRLKDKYFYGYDHMVSSSYTPLGMKECLPFFCIWMVGSAISLIILCTEILYNTTRWWNISNTARTISKFKQHRPRTIVESVNPAASLSVTVRSAPVRSLRAQKCEQKMSIFPSQFIQESTSNTYSLGHST